ncbi:MAG TPA: phosphatase PAP2 family protein [Methanotrichaceae archaeon]|nr:phosphatase PAP2 family protein [Methanotrichaceae archaeon]
MEINGHGGCLEHIQYSESAESRQHHINLFGQPKVSQKNNMCEPTKENAVNRKIALAFVLMLAFAISLSYAASRFPILPLDLQAYQELHEEARPLFNMLLRGVSYLGEPAMAMILIVMVAAAFASRRQWIETIFVLATTSNVLLTFVLKELIRRARPVPLPGNATGFIQSINEYSYPSGHVLFFVVFFGFFAYLAWIYFAGRVRVIVIAICGALIILIGPSRVFLGAHWASDVLGSYIIGAIWLFVLIIAYQWAMRWKHHDPS